ncbi:PREDICTED: uncharacterized protein C1orf101-like isoform X2 [Priapulus caudatus]|uniref:Uncharacterized protein C1orf101-like isoform X2 n=1 Tax=Priapulus caudatus TaxID=37621 RepID=A0ABM1DPJ1_PRICU|nr:PREDICTED: uncharacterized protein C1orf101-like isoform X2 [Priapulus caudatus]
MSKLFVYMLFLALIFRLVLCVWRYRAIFGNEDMFTTRSIIELHYVTVENDEAIEWQASRTCLVSNSSAHTTEVTCPAAGQFGFAVKHVLSDVTDPVRYITVSNNHACYSWYLVVSSVEKDWSRQNLELKLWILDVLHQSVGETNRTSLQPSQYSASITRVFYTRGQDPTLSEMLHNADDFKDWFSPLKFDEACSCWMFTSNSQSSMAMHHQLAVKISGSLFGLYDCFVDDTVVMLTMPKFPLPAAGADDPDVFIAAVATPIAIRDACDENVAAIVGTDSFLLTQDNFRTVTKVRIPEQALGSRSILSAAFSSNHVALLTDDALYMCGDEGNSCLSAEGLPATGLLGVKGRDWCFMGLSSGGMNKMFAVWNASSVFINNPDNFGTFVELDLPTDLLPGIPAIVHHVAFGASDHLIGAMVSPASDVSQVLLLEFNMQDVSWTATELQIQNHEQPDDFRAGLMYLLAGVPTYLYWSPFTMFMQTTRVGGASDDMLLYSTTLSQEAIQQVAATHGDYLIQLDNNKALFGKMGLQSTVQIELGYLSDSKVALVYDAMGAPYALTATDGTVDVRKLPLRNEIESTLYPERKCQYIHFDHNVTSLLYHLDLGETLLLWASVVYKATYAQSVRILSHGSTCLVCEPTTTSLQGGHNILAQNTTFLFHLDGKYMENTSYGDWSSNSTGIVSFELRPELFDVDCPSPVQVVAQISVGCHPSRHIRVYRADGNGTCERLYNYTISARHLLDEKEDVVEEYDWDALGCPHMAHIKEKYVPVLHMYDGDVFVKQVHADFVMWEERRRSDYAYSATMGDVGCLREAQTWAAMMAAAPPSTNLSATWSTQNYRSCFSWAAGEFNGSQLYEVLNSSAASSIVWAQNMSTIHVFNVRVVDHDYSFCQLETRFGVRIYGATEPQDLTTLAVAVGVFLLALTVGLGFTYYYYRRLFLNECKAL